MIDEFFLNSFINGKEDYTNDNNMIVGVVRSSITQMSKSSSKSQIATRQVTNKLLKSVTSNMVTEIVVEVVSGLYRKEEQAVNLSFNVLNKVIEPELKQIALDAIEEYQIFRENSNNAYNQDTSMNFSIANSEIYYAPQHDDQPQIDTQLSARDSVLEKESTRTKHLIESNEMQR